MKRILPAPGPWRIEPKANGRMEIYDADGKEVAIVRGYDALSFENAKVLAAAREAVELLALAVIYSEDEPHEAPWVTSAVALLKGLKAKREWKER